MLSITGPQGTPPPTTHPAVIITSLMEETYPDYQLLNQQHDRFWEIYGPMSHHKRPSFSPRKVYKKAELLSLCFPPQESRSTGLSDLPVELRSKNWRNAFEDGLAVTLLLKTMEKDEWYHSERDPFGVLLNCNANQIAKYIEVIFHKSDETKGDGGVAYSFKPSPSLLFLVSSETRNEGMACWPTLLEPDKSEHWVVRFRPGTDTIRMAWQPISPQPQVSLRSLAIIFYSLSPTARTPTNPLIHRPSHGAKPPNSKRSSSLPTRRHPLTFSSRQKYSKSFDLSKSSLPITRIGPNGFGLSQLEKTPSTLSFIGTASMHLRLLRFLRRFLGLCPVG